MGQGKFPVTEAGKSVKDTLEANSSDLTPEDIIRVSSQLASLVDPTGGSDVVGSYTYPLCSKIKVWFNLKWYHGKFL